jgi:hypothetical protein
MIKKIDKLLSKIEPPNWVLAIVAVVALLRIPTLFEPYYYGDEMIYLTLGNALRKGLTLYSEIHDNKPPLLYIIAAISGNLFWFKAILMFWMIITIMIFWHLAHLLFEKNQKAQYIAVAIFALLTTIPLFEGHIVNAELFLIGPTILGIFLLLKNPTNKNIFIAGIAFAVAALFKVPAVFDVPVVIIYWLVTAKNSKNIIDITKKTFLLFIVFIIPIALTFVWYFLHNAAGDYLRAAFLQNIGYLSSWGGNQNTSFVVKNGPLLIRAGIVVIGLIILRIFSPKLGKAFLVSSIWALTALFAVTLSGRPYPHYMIQAVPAISLLVAILIASINIEQVLSIIPLTIVALVPTYYKFYQYPTFSYYTNFASYAKGQESKWQYFSNFDKNAETNYKTAEIITKMTGNTDKVFVWGSDSATVYALSKRLPPIKYVADYHITDFSSLPEVANKLAANPPSLIVFLPNSPSFMELNNLLSRKYVLINSSETKTQIWHYQN